MCFAKPKSSGAAEIIENQQKQIEQLHKNNAVLSNQKVAETTAEKKTNKRTVSSLRVPLDKTTKTSNTGVNTGEAVAGLNIPV